MEEAKPRPGSPGDRSHTAAEKLRALRERASAALGDHRRRVEQIEAELSLRIQQLSDEFEAGSADAVQRASASQSEEIAALRRQVEEGRAKHEKFIEQLAAARRQLEAIQTQPCPACQDSAELLAATNDEARILRERLDAASKQHQEDQARHAKFTTQLAEARKAMADLQNESGDQTARLQTELQSAVEAMASAEERLAASSRDVEILHAECEVLQDRADQLEQELAVAETESTELRRRAEGLAAQLKQLQEHPQSAEPAVGDEAKQRELAGRLAAADAELTELRERASALEHDKKSIEDELGQAKTSQQKAEAALAAAEAEAASLRECMATVEQTQAAIDEELSSTVAGRNEALAAVESAKADIGKLRESFAALEFEKRTVEQEKRSLGADLATTAAARDELQAALDKAKQELTAAQALAEAGAATPELQAALDKAAAEAASQTAEIAKLHALLEAAEKQLAQQRETMAPRADLDSLQQKFDLALADVQKLKRENSSLREELSQRPEAGNEPSPELVAVRAERDALAQRVAELESAEAPAVDANLQQELEDLQRRFEMAVDDLREHKQENARLREQLAAKPAAAPAAGGAGGSMDWASQRARLMEQLEQEDGASADEPARKQERATIEGTIAITDRLIAEKEQELADLRSAHIARGNSDVIDRELERLLGADEKVAAERERLAALQTELEEKLRAAELEISLERAKLAREQAALKERLVDLQLAAPAGGGVEVEGGKRRRWLTALGLGDDEEDGAKK